MPSLTIVGTGIQFASQTTPAARAAIEQAGKVLYIVADPAASAWLGELNPTAESLHVFYGYSKYRLTTYQEMVERILSFVRAGLDVCVVAYGHPGVFATPMHESLRRARSEGFSARMLPGISAEDCLYADLGVDPGASGCQSFDATDFLVYRRTFDPACSLVLWQIAVTGDLGYKEVFSRDGLRVLIDLLLHHYAAEHEVVVYEAAQYSFSDPIIQCVPLAKVPEVRITPISTLFVPPKAPASPDVVMMDRLGIPRSLLRG